MIFSCDRCGRRYSVPDERVQGRRFRVTCKACGHVIMVPGSAPATQAAPPAPPPPPRAPAPRVEIPMPPFDEPAPPREAAPPADDPFAAREEPALFPREEAPPPTAPPPAAPEPEAEPERTLTTAEIDWLSRNHGPVPGAAHADPPAAPHRGPGLFRVLLVAGLLGVVAAGAVAVLWPTLRHSPPAPRPSTPAPLRGPHAQGEPGSVPAPAPEPSPAVAPAVAPQTAPLAGPAAPAEPDRAVTSRARFEPGTVKVGRVRRKDAPSLSRKDRRLLDLLERKEDSAPPEPVEALDLDTGRSLDPAAVERVLAESQGAFSGCISRNARPGQEERATLLLTVDATGAVTSAWIAEADLAKGGLGRCLATAGRRLAFPAFEGPPVDVSVPLHLEAR